MSLARPFRQRGGHFSNDGRSSYGGNSNMGITATAAANYNHDIESCNKNFGIKDHGSACDFSRSFVVDGPNYDRVWPEVVPSSKRRKVSALSFESTGRPYQQKVLYENGLENYANQWQYVPPQHFDTYCNAQIACNNSSADFAATRSDNASGALTTSKRDRSMFEDDDELFFLSRDEIERCSPSRKDGIDALHETQLRYSYCAFLQNLGIQLDIPQTTIGTAMVLCHRFFVRRSHASHDSYLIATAALFLAAKSEETARPLNDVLRVSCEIVHNQDFSLLSYMLPIDWFEQYRERITVAEQLILTTLNFELNVQHPYESLTSTLQKLGFSQSLLVNLALNLVSEGIFRGLACSPYDIISWRLMCCSSHVLFFI